MMALELGKIRGEFSTSEYRALLNELSILPKKVEKVLESKHLLKISLRSTRTRATACT